MGQALTIDRVHNNHRIFRQYFWSESGNVGQLSGAVAQKRRERHPVYVSGWRSIGSIRISVRIQPDDSNALLSFSVKGGDSGNATDGYRMISSENHR